MSDKKPWSMCDGVGPPTMGVVVPIPGQGLTGNGQQVTLKPAPTLDDWKRMAKRLGEALDATEYAAFFGPNAQHIREKVRAAMADLRKMEGERG